MVKIHINLVPSPFVTVRPKMALLLDFDKCFLLSTKYMGMVNHWRICKSGAELFLCLSLGGLQEGGLFPLLTPQNKIYKSVANFMHILQVALNLP